eukprot:357029-Chlamydomonas_euryale.AAC.2
MPERREMLGAVEGRERASVGQRGRRGATSSHLSGWALEMVICSTSSPCMVWGAGWRPRAAGHGTEVPVAWCGLVLDVAMVHAGRAKLGWRCMQGGPS